MSIEKIKFLNLDATKINYDKYTITILHGRGCNIVDFKVQKEDELLSILHIPTEDDSEEFGKSPQRFGSAILFPPNKITDGKYDWEGKTYDLTGNGIHFAHGVLKEYPYELVEARETIDGIYLKYTMHSSVTPYFKAFNWDFNVTFEFELTKDGLSQIFTVENIGEENIPFGAGYHTAFLFPQNDKYTADDYRIQVSSDLQWETDGNLNPSGNLIKMRIPYNEGNIHPLSEALNDHIRAVPASNGFNRATITNIKNGQQFVYETDPSFKNWMIWNNKAGFDYVCIEPMTCIVDAPHSTLPASEHGFMTLAPGNSWSGQVLFYAL